MPIKPLPAIGDPDGKISAGPSKPFDALEPERRFCLYRRGDKVACYRTRETADAVLSGFRRGGGGVRMKVRK